MKNILSFVIFLFCSFSLIAQVTPAFNYQGIAVDAQGAAVENSDIGLKFTISDALSNGNVLYAENQTSTTTGIGYFNANVGQGNVEIGSTGDINWGDGARFLTVEMDVNGGTDYSFSSTTPFYAVPFALAAQDADVVLNPGRVGPAGPQGATGATGATGFAGLNGLDGDFQGLAGIPGEMGPEGDVGPIGPPGASAGAPGEKGPDGEIGPPGNEGFGNTGPQGPRGATGPTGPSSANGAKGPQGDPGPSSTEVGPTGPQGPDGLPGGANGVNGANGAPGNTGPQGLSGAQGLPGFSFYQTVTMTNIVPTPSQSLNIYLDSGANRADNTPGLRYYHATLGWIDL